MLLNKLYNAIFFRLELFQTKLYSIRFMVRCHIQGILYGKGLKLYGMPFTRIAKGGSIKIGDQCAFRSNSTSNYIGINHPCILAATPAYAGTKAELNIGNKCGFSGVSIWCFKSISIGNNVRVGANTLIMDGDAHYNDPRTPKPEAITIEDDVFIGANCVIKKGVRIGQGAMVGMNSVVTKDLPPYSVSVGCPAKVVRYFNNNEM